MNRTQRGKVVGFLVPLLFLSGCGDGAAPKVAPVTGRVLFNNKAVTGAEIYFHPDAEKGNNGAMGSAILQEDGSFEITTYPKGNGVAPGAYKVTLAGGITRRPEKELVKFRKVTTTPLKFDVPEEGLRDLVIDLSADEKAPTKQDKSK